MTAEEKKQKIAKLRATACSIREDDASPWHDWTARNRAAALERIAANLEACVRMYG